MTDREPTEARNLAANPACTLSVRAPGVDLAEPFGATRWSFGG